MTAPPVYVPAVSRICAGCDGPMVISRDACGNERLRCPTCHGVSNIRAHPDDAMLPQGLVRSDSVRVVRQVVRVEVPGQVERIVALPPIDAGQLRCQTCAEGVHPTRRFCTDCAPGGQLILEAYRLRDNAARGGQSERRYKPKPCRRCGESFQPTGPRALDCEACR